MKFLFIPALILFSQSAFSRPIEINVRDYGWLTSFPPLKDVLDFYIQGVEDDVNEEQPLINPSRLNYGTANSTVLASKGLGTDYVNNPEKFQISLGIGAAWDEERNKAIKDEISGAAAASSVAIGLKLDQKLMGFVNFGTLKHSRDFPGRDIDIAGEIEATNFGLHLRYDLIRERGSEMWGWGGVKIHFGYEYNVNEVDLTTKLDEELEVDTGGSGVLSGRLTGNPTYQIETNTHSVPLEFSSSLNFLKIFSLYGGFGSDLNFGSSVGKGVVKGDLSTLACTSGVCVGETVLPQLQVQANYDARFQVRNVTFRAFTGLQIDLPFRLHAYGQVEQMLGTKVIGASAGLKYTF